MSLKNGQTAVENDFLINIVAGEALTALDAVYILASDGKAYKCDSDDLAKIGFIGFAMETVSLGANVTIKTWGVIAGFAGLTIGAEYYAGPTAGGITATKPTNFKIVGHAVTATMLRVYTGLTKRVRTFTTLRTSIGSGTTQFDITNPAGTTFRYTWDGTGTDPVINSGTFPIGSTVVLRGQNFHSANQGVFVVTGVGANYVEVTNASGVVESNKTISGGYVGAGVTYQRTPGTKHVKVQIVAGGDQGDNEADSDSSDFAGNGGNSGAYAEKVYLGNDLSEYNAIEIGTVNQNSYFANLLSCISFGTATGGDINIDGAVGGNGGDSTGGKGADSPLGTGGPGATSADTNGNAATGYGAGGGGGGNSGTPTGVGGAGTQGACIITEEY